MKELSADVLAVVGAMVVTYGAHLVYRPAGWIVGGALLLVAAWLVAKAG